ncbi:MAG TPA: PTS sugar transporter subunit IIA [Phycisphaerales bacterium]|nr:PTS sugar transporter subunit IIA [Phycisphaerales bacterium]
MLKLSELVLEGAIVPSVAGTDRDSVVRELVAALAKAGAFPANLEKEIQTRTLERERKATTGFGRGVAVPHVKHTGITKMAAAIGLTQRGLDFASLDKQPVYFVFLLASPEDKPEDHLRAMEVIFKNLNKESFRRHLRQCTTVEEVRQMLQDADTQHLIV